VYALIVRRDAGPPLREIKSLLIELCDG
jgi:hypothetical protein